MLTATLAASLLACAPGLPPPLQAQEAWVQVDSPAAQALLRTLPVGFAEGREPGRVRIVGTPEALDQVAAAGLPVTVLGPPAALPAHAPTAAEVEQVLGDWAEAWPDRAFRARLGTSVEGLPLWGIRLGDPEAPVHRRIVGGLHGDEVSSVSLALALGDALLTEASGFEGLLDAGALWLVPLANPDGYDAGARFNRNNVDLNRNFSYLWSPSEYAPGTEPFSEPETKALRTLSLGLGLPVGLSLHAGATNLGYVWNHTSDDTWEEERLVALGQTYADACTQGGFYLTNGADWYTTRGDLNDWSYGVQGTLDYTLEITSNKSPEPDALAEALDAHLPAAAAFLSAPLLLQGQLISADSGRGLHGSLVVEDATGPFPTDLQGRFARALEPGSWSVTATAPGHASATFDVTLDDDGPSDLTWSLTPTTLTQVRPEPVRLSQGTGSARLVLEGVAPPDTVSLSRPGVDSLFLAFDGTGYPVSPSALVPGAYTLSGDEWVAPRALFAGAFDDRVAVSAVTLTPDCVVLDGNGFAEGTQVWGLWGLDRAQVPLGV